MIRVVPSLLLRKYVGETSLMTRAVFSAAKKLQPCILFVDEMDALFRWEIRLMLYPMLLFDSRPY